jgi:FkbM family methyltransferase
MIRSLVRRALARATSPKAVGTDAFLNNCRRVIHVGANSGQEREVYRRHGLKVVWIEPIPAVFEKLKHNLIHYPDQIALQALVTDQDDKEYTFHVASNEGASSSILEFGQHGDIWPEVRFEHTLQLKSITLTSLFQKHSIAPSAHDALVMDTQGSELLVLQGALPILQHFRFIKTEVADFEVYEGCCQLNELKTFLEAQGFHELARDTFATHPSGGKCYDVLFARR